MAIVSYYCPIITKNAQIKRRRQIQVSTHTTQAGLRLGEGDSLPPHKNHKSKTPIKGALILLLRGLDKVRTCL